MRELIYRDEAIKAVYDKDIGMLTQWDIGRNNGIDYAIKQLEKLPSARPEYEPVAAEDFAKTMSETSVYSYMVWYSEALSLMKRQGFVICKKTM